MGTADDTDGFRMDIIDSLVRETLRATEDKLTAEAIEAVKTGRGSALARTIARLAEQVEDLRHVLTACHNNTMQVEAERDRYKATLAAMADTYEDNRWVRASRLALGIHDPVAEAERQVYWAKDNPFFGNPTSRVQRHCEENGLEIASIGPPNEDGETPYFLRPARRAVE